MRGGGEQGSGTRTPTGTDGRRVWSVTELVHHVRNALERGYGTLTVEGEVAELTVARSGHVYFTVCDDSQEASLRAVMWRSRYGCRTFDLERGIRVQLTGKLTLYPARGAFQMDVVSFAEAGEGKLARQFKEVVERLEAEGLTAPNRKRPIPFLPRRVGVVTSATGAALRDILKVLSRRFPVPVLLSHSPVQGEDAPAKLTSALERLGRVQDVDVVILGRGGGSAEDLAAFNDEKLARRVASHPVPIISAVGHEVDVAVTDLVADRRAATPSEAAELAVPLRSEVFQRLTSTQRQLGRAMQAHIVGGRNRLLRLDGRLPRPDRILMDRRMRLDELLERMVRAGPQARIVQGRHALDMTTQRCASVTRQRVQHSRGSLAEVAASLQALSPLAVLSRGYAVVRRRDDQAVIRSHDQVAVGEALSVRLEHGVLGCTVESTGEEE